MTKQEYLSQNAMPWSTSYDISRIPDAAWPAALAAAEMLAGPETRPGIDTGMWIREGYAHGFDAARSASWAVSGTRDAFFLAGMPCVRYSDFVFSDGKFTHTMILIDAGSCRIALRIRSTAMTPAQTATVAASRDASAVHTAALAALTAATAAHKAATAALAPFYDDITAAAAALDDAKIAQRAAADALIAVIDGYCGPGSTPARWELTP